MFKNVVYSSENGTLRLLHGYVTISIRNLGKSAFDARPKLEIDVEGVEYYWYNRKDLYDWLEKYVVNKEPYHGEEFVASSRKPFFLFPIYFIAKKVCIFVGNDMLPCTLVLASSSVVGSLSVAKTPSENDLYRWILSAECADFESWICMKKESQFVLGESSSLEENWYRWDCFLTENSESLAKKNLLSTKKFNLSYYYDQPGPHLETSSSISPEFAIEISVSECFLRYGTLHEAYR